MLAKLKSVELSYLAILLSFILIFGTLEVTIRILHDVKNNGIAAIPDFFEGLSSKLSQPTKSTTTVTTDAIPFRSNLIDISQSRIVENDSIWISSASHGEDLSYSASEIFPNLICNHLVDSNNRYCLNHSKAGWTIADNLAGIKEIGANWDPEFIILYQMSIDIQRMSGKTYDPSGDSNSNIRQPYSTHIKSHILELIESTTLYKDIREFIGSSLLVQAPLPENLPLEAAEEYFALIDKFVIESRAINAQPILTTFAFSHSSDQWESVPFRTKTWVMLWQTDMSPFGFVKTIETYNDFVRSYAIENNIILVDIARAVGGKPEYFRDPVHFNQLGHEKVAQAIAEKISSMEADTQ